MSLAELFANNYFLRLLRGRTSNYDLIVSMVGPKLGERLLQMGGGDGLLLAALGKKTGLTGQVSAVEPDAEAAERVKDQATKDGVLPPSRSTSSSSRWEKAARCQARRRRFASCGPAGDSR